MLAECVGSHRLAGFGPADLNDVFADRVPLEFVVEGQDTVDFGARAVQRFCNHRQGCIRYVAQLVLQVVEDLKQLIGLIAVAGTRCQRRDLTRGRGRRVVRS